MVAQATLRADRLAITTEEVLRQGNNDLRKETEVKICKFTENLTLEFKYLNKRLEDKILFQIGFYKTLPKDPHQPVQYAIPTIAYEKPVDRPNSGHPQRPLNFEQALSQATEEAGHRLKKAY